MRSCVRVAALIALFQQALILAHRAIPMHLMNPETSCAKLGKLRVYNTLTQRLEVFEPKIPGKVGLYVCGPTVYDVPHAGHARSALAFDVLVRHLKHSGYDVTFVRNITDIDDKILNRAKDSGEAPLELSARMTQIYLEDMAQLNCLTPTHQPKVSEHVEDIVVLIGSIIDKQGAYVVERPDGVNDVYFSVRDFGSYGQLSRRKLDDLEVGARVDKSDLKRDPMDFALWKGAHDEDYGWPSPWGRGRPGWHIECSAMSERYLGFGFDIHGGGMDLIFPHHENEIAQSEAAHPGMGNFARYWMHNGFVNVDKEKMSKSLGNFVTVRDVFERNDPEGFRYFLLTVQYRGPLTFDSQKLECGRVVFPGVDEAERRVDYLYATLSRLQLLVDEQKRMGAAGASGGAVGDKQGLKVPSELCGVRKIIDESLKKLCAALDDDLNTPVALAVIADLAKHANDLCDLALKRRKDAAFVAAAVQMAPDAYEALRACTQALGLLAAPIEQYTERTTERRLRLRGISKDEVQQAIDARTEARKNKDFARADELRSKLDTMGIEISDSVSGTAWKVGV